MDHGKKEASAPNMFAYKRKRIFEYEDLSEDEGSRGTIGIPRVLNIYENFPFWAVFFRKLGFRILLSPFSDSRMLTLGMDSIPSESACYPAKLAHGHIEWLISHGVKTIFYPCIYYERKEDQSSQNHYNCPMVTSYPENIRNNVENLKEKNIRYLDPFLAFTNEEVLGNGLADFMGKAFKISKKEVLEAVGKAGGSLLITGRMWKGKAGAYWNGWKNIRQRGSFWQADPIIWTPESTTAFRR